jgi:hypothetical protein
MRRQRSPLISILLALLFLAAQQVAFAHMISHIGAAGGPTVVAGDAGHGAAAGHVDTCVTCVALAALTGGAPLPAPLATPTVATAAVEPLLPALPVCTGVAASPYLARAPPAVR